MDKNWTICRYWFLAIDIHTLFCDRHQFAGLQTLMVKKKLYFAAGTVMIIALAVIYYRFNPAKYSFFPKCPFYVLTGFDCPGCGSQRAVSALLHGNLKAALGFNFLLVACLPFLAVHFFYKARSAWQKNDNRNSYSARTLTWPIAAPRRINAI